MIINQFIKHDLYTQTGNFSFNVTVTPNDITGINIFGLSGSKNKNNIEFKFISGHIIDWHNQFVGVYNNTDKNLINISGIVGSNSVDYYINNKPIAFGIQRTTGYLDTIYANSYYNSFNLDLFINGSQPAYSINSLISFQTGTSFIPFSIFNNSLFPFSIFSGDYLGETDRFSLSGIPTGIVPSSGSLVFNLLPSGNNLAGSNFESFNFYTNFGIINPSINFSGIVDPFSGLFLELVGPSVISNGNTGQYIAYYNNMGNTFINVIPFLQYASGSGLQTSNMIISGAYNINMTGFINYSGNLFKNISMTGFGYGGFSQTYSSGIISSTILNFQWPTGSQLSTMLITGSGIASGIGYTGLSSGLISVIIGGDILDGSGFYHATGLFTGLPNFAYSINPTGTIQATGAIYYNSPLLYDVLYINSNSQAIVNGYQYNNITNLTSYINNNSNLYYVTATQVGGQINLTSIKSGLLGNSIITKIDPSNIGTMSTSNSSLIGGKSFGVGLPTIPLSQFTGYFGGNINGTGIYSQQATGIILSSISINDFYRQFTGSWNLITGSNDFRKSGFYSSNKDAYIYKGGGINKQIGSFNINIPYSLLGTGQDVVTLFLSGLNTNHSVNQLISGGI